MQHNARIFVLKLRCVTSCPLHACVGLSQMHDRLELLQITARIGIQGCTHALCGMGCSSYTSPSGQTLCVSCIQGFTLDLSPSKSPAPEASRIYTRDKCKLGRLVASWSHLCHRAMKFCLVGGFILPISIVLESRGAEWCAEHLIKGRSSPPSTS